MKKELKDLLLSIKDNPLPGGSRDAKMVLAQVEEIFALDELNNEVKTLKENINDFSRAATKESRSMRHLTIALGVVALLQLLIAYGQYRLGEVQIESSREQVGLQDKIWDYEKMRNDRIEERDVNWRKEDLQSQGRLPK